ncbi:MAG: ABC transporter ATP-binding protein [Chloroflexota bacterium]
MRMQAALAAPAPETSHRPDAVEAAAVIRVRDLRKRYGAVQAVDGISFEVRPGEVFGMLGPNGAGKTTTVEIMEGLRVPDSGEVVVAGINVARDPERVKRAIGVQLQSNAFFTNLKLTELLKLFADIYDADPQPRRLLERVDLQDKADSYFSTLSGGQKQRFSIAVALVHQPGIIFLDEPSTGLDPQARRHMWDLIKSLKADGTTVVLTTHYMEEAEELCDRVAIVDRGRIVAIDSPDALVDALLNTGFRNKRPAREADLEDVFIHLTGHALREE